MKFQTVIVGAAVVLALVGGAQAHEYHFKAELSGPNESPPNGSAGTGTAEVMMDLDLVTMRVEVSFADLSGNVTAAHIHGITATAGSGTADVATQVPTFTGFPSGVTSGSYDHTFDLAEAGTYNPDFITASGGTIGQALNALFFGMSDGKTYLNIHTTAFPGGEIRGFLEFEPHGDFDMSGVVDAPDIDRLWQVVRGGDASPFAAEDFDINEDGLVNEDDVDHLLEDHLAFGPGRHYGDADLDGDVDGADFDAWRTRPGYTGAGSGKWTRGDFDGDGDVDGADFDLWRLRPDEYPTGVGAHGGGLHAVPEPGALVLALSGAAGALGLCRGRSR